MKKNIKHALSFTLSSALLLSSCAQLSNAPKFSFNKAAVASSRMPASEYDSLIHYLYIDKFKYYINEYSVAMEGKIPDEIIKHLRSIDPQDIIKMGFNTKQLEDSMTYDDLIWGILEKKKLTTGVNKTNLKWGYNFFKRKLNEAFTLSESALKIKTHVEEEIIDPNDGKVLNAPLLDTTKQTLDDNHYIANRNTQAIFWEANQNGRTIEFYLGDSREFLKRLTDDKGEVAFEVKPLAKNYNKIFIVKYPNEEKYRVVMTNVGGADRLNHLVSQLSLSLPAGTKPKAKILVNGNLESFQKSREEEHVLQLKLLPKADRYIIGQKESIDGKFEIFSRMNTLSELREQNPSVYNEVMEKLGAKDKAKFEALLDDSEDFEKLFNQKSIIDAAFESFEAIAGKAEDNTDAPKFKVYNFDNFTVEMCDYVFKNSEGKNIRWRVVSNVWGDEILPLAKAIKRSSTSPVSYIGTAGAFGGKGYKVGDLVSPKFVYDGDSKLAMQSKPLAIEEAKVEGAVEHVGSPFEEDVAWLNKVSKRSEFVEVETSYLRRVFNSPKDELEIFLLISDILGSETETLAHATSSKRKNSQTRLLASIFKRDSKRMPKIGSDLTISNLIQKNKSLIFQVLKDKSLAYKHFVFSNLKNEKALTEKKILAFTAEEATFTDDFILSKLTSAGEILQEIYERDKKGINFKIAMSDGLFSGKWNPKNSPLEVVLIASNPTEESQLNAILKDLDKFTSTKKKDYKFSVSTIAPTGDFVIINKPKTIDMDYMVKIYNYSALSSSGVYRKVTYNGNVVLDYLPTHESVEAEQIIKSLGAIKSTPGIKLPANLSSSAGCADLVEAFLQNY